MPAAGAAPAAAAAPAAGTAPAAGAAPAAGTPPGDAAAAGDEDACWPFIDEDEPPGEHAVPAAAELSWQAQQYTGTASNAHPDSITTVATPHLYRVIPCCHQHYPFAAQHRPNAVSVCVE